MEFVVVAMWAATWIAPSIAIGVWAESKGKSFLTGFLLSFFTSPLIGAVLVASMSDQRQPLRHH